MRRIALRFAVALITFILGVALASGWHSLRKSSTVDLPIPDAEGKLEYTSNISSSDADRELVEIYRQYASAQTKHDVAFFERVETEGFILFDRYGRSLTRTEDIELLKGLDPNTNYSQDDLKVQVYGDGAIVTGRMTASFSRGGQYSWPWIDVCVKRNGRWQILSTTQLY